RYTGQNDIILGTPIAGRQHPDLENQLGLFLNTLAIRTCLDEKHSFSDIVLKQKEILSNAYQYQDYPFDELVTKLNLKKDTS
ncbi:condensation domain-containing protein, partial [Bacillus sp. SIMBA_031]